MSMSANLITLLFVCIVGLCLGSFFNVVILRSLSGESIVFPPSKCPNCGNKLKPIHNIPILSYILLKGRCAFCNKPISLQYPIVEFITMVLFAACYIKFGQEPRTLFAMAICSALIIMSGTDIKERAVDCRVAIGLAVTGLLFNFIYYREFLYPILGLIAAAGIIEIIARVGQKIYEKRAMGEADTYVAGAIGACFGLYFVVTFFAYALLASMICIFPLYLYKQYKKNNIALCSTALAFIISVLIYSVVLQNFITYLILVFTGILLAYLVLKDMNNLEKLTYIPFVPALSAGALITLFFVL